MRTRAEWNKWWHHKLPLCSIFKGPWHKANQFEIQIKSKSWKTCLPITRGVGVCGGTPSLRVSRYAPWFCPPFLAPGRPFCPQKFDLVYHFIQILLGLILNPLFSACRQSFWPPKLTKSIILFRSCWVPFWNSSGAPLLFLTPSASPPPGAYNPIMHAHNTKIISVSMLCSVPKKSEGFLNWAMKHRLTKSCKICIFAFNMDQVDKCYILTHPTPYREKSPVTQTTPEFTLLSWGEWPFEKIFPHPWPHCKSRPYLGYRTTKTQLFSSPLILLRCVTEIQFAQNLHWHGNWH